MADRDKERLSLIVVIIVIVIVIVIIIAASYISGPNSGQTIRTQVLTTNADWSKTVLVYDDNTPGQQSWRQLQLGNGIPFSGLWFQTQVMGRGTGFTKYTIQGGNITVQLWNYQTNPVKCGLTGQLVGAIGPPQSYQGQYNVGQLYQVQILNNYAPPLILLSVNTTSPTTNITANQLWPAIQFCGIASGGHLRYHVDILAYSVDALPPVYAQFSEDIDVAFVIVQNGLVMTAVSQQSSVG